MKVISTDGGGKTGTAAIVVTVDRNDAPSFINPQSYNTDVSEAIGVMQPILTVRASDPDPVVSYLPFVNLESFD